MLMPILTVRTPVVPVQAVPGEAVMLGERTAAASSPTTANPSTALLKILETLNGRLGGRDGLAQDALIRLMETLARILKFPPLPQESLRDFGQRLAVFLETLPPETRLALQKQLGQRTVAVAVRLLTEALRNPAALDSPRTAPGLPGSNAFSSPAGLQVTPQMPANIIPAALAAQLARQPVPQATLTIGTPQDPALLQAVLRKTFGETDTAGDAFSETAEAGPPAIGGEKAGDKPDTVRSVAPAVARQQGNTDLEAVPPLRAAAAFLATDAQALSQITAIATDDGVQADRGSTGQPAPDLAEAGGAVPSVTLIDDDDAIDQRLAMRPAEVDEAMADRSERISGEARPVAATPANIRTEMRGDPVASAQTEKPFHAGDIATTGAGMPPADEAFWILDDMTQALPDMIADMPDLPQERPTKILAETLKALVQNSLPLPDIAARETVAMSYAAAGEPEPLPLNEDSAFIRRNVELIGDMPEWKQEKPAKPLAETLKTLVQNSLPLPGAAAREILATPYGAVAQPRLAAFAANAAFVPLEAMLEAAMPEISTGPAAEMDDAEGWTGALETTDDDATDPHPPWASRASPGDADAQPFLPRPPDMGLPRDIVPFMLIPYPAAQRLDAAFLDVEEDRQASGDEAEADEQAGPDDETSGSGGDRPQGGEAADDTATPPADETVDTQDSEILPDAYRLYMRMGELG